MPTPIIRVHRDVCPDRLDDRYQQEISTDYTAGQGRAFFGGVRARF